MSHASRRSFIKNVAGTGVLATSVGLVPSGCSKQTSGPSSSRLGSGVNNKSEFKAWTKGEAVKLGDIRVIDKVPFIYVSSSNGKMEDDLDSDWRILQEWESGFVVIDDLGLSPDNDCTSALKFFAKLAAQGVCSRLHFLAKDYILSDSVTFSSPVSIEGSGALFELNGQRSGTRIHDNREHINDKFLLNFTDGNNPTCAIRIMGLELVGKENFNNSAIFFSLAGWSIFVQNIIVRDFHGTGIKFDMVNDGTYEDVHILNCGGRVNNEVSYSLDLTPSGKRYTNHSVFLRLHIEHSRYQIRLAGFFLHFIGCHFEIGNPKVVDNELPVIDIRKVARPISFTACDFVGSESAQGVNGERDGAAFFAATSARKQLEGIDEFNTSISFSQCNFCVPKGAVRFIDLSEVALNLESCTFINCLSMAKIPVRVGATSGVSSNRFVVTKGSGEVLELCGQATVVGNNFSCIVPGDSAISYKGPRADAVGLNNLIGYRSLGLK